MHRFRHLMVGLARTKANWESDAELLRYVAMVARLGTATKVRFVHCVPGGQGDLSTGDIEPIMADMKAQVERSFLNVPETVEREYIVHQGPPVDHLLHEAAEHEIELLFLGHRRVHKARWALTRRVVMKSPCSVWLVPDGSAALLQRILVPIDFSEPSADAIRVAVSLARLSGIPECTALHAYFNPAVSTYDEYDSVLLGKEQRAFEKFMEKIDSQGIFVHPIFEECVDASHSIVRAAKAQDSDLIVMATKGRSRAAAVLLGSVTEAAILATPTPLLAVKHSGSHMRLLEALFDRRFRKRSDLRTD